eukprot:768141-Hanusia_phi.AAC.2
MGSISVCKRALNPDEQCARGGNGRGGGESGGEVVVVVVEMVEGEQGRKSILRKGAGRRKGGENFIRRRGEGEESRVPKESGERSEEEEIREGIAKKKPERKRGSKEESRRGEERERRSEERRRDPRRGEEIRGEERRGEERRGEERRGEERRGEERRGEEKRGGERRGKEIRGDQRRGEEIRGEERSGVEWRGEEKRGGPDRERGREISHSTPARDQVRHLRYKQVATFPSTLITLFSTKLTTLIPDKTLSSCCLRPHCCFLFSPISDPYNSSFPL